MIYIPRKDSLRDRICTFIATNGPSTMRQIREAFKAHRYDTLKDAVFHLGTFGALVRESEGYQLSKMVGRHYGQCIAEEEAQEEAPAPIVQPRTAPEFRPLSAKYMLPKIPPRDDALPLRDIYFKTGSVGFSVGYQV